MRDRYLTCNGRVDRGRMALASVPPLLAFLALVRGYSRFTLVAATIGKMAARIACSCLRQRR